MAIKIQNSTIIDDSRNIVNAGVGTFLTSINVGSSGTILSAANRQLNENILSISDVNNLSALEITGIGSVGIGTSAPLRALHVNGNGFLVSSGSTTVFSADSYDASGRILSVTSLTNTPALEITGIGSVGIGTSTPLRALHVNGNGFLVSNNNVNLLSVESFNASSTSIFEVLDDSNNKIIGVTSNTFAVSNPIQQILNVDTANATENIFSVINQNNASALEITGIGSVGIGISTPTKALHINGNGILISTGSTNIFSVDTISTGNNSFEVLDVSGNMAFQVSGIGSVGIGTSSPSKALHVSGTGMVVSSGSTSIFSVDTFGGADNIFEVLDPSNNVILGISTNNVGVGTTNATSKLHVEGNALVTGILTTNSSAQFPRVGLGTTAGTIMNLMINGATAIKQDTISPSSGVYTINIASANEFITSGTISGITTFNLSNLGQLPTGFIWRGVLSFGYSSGTVNWFTGNVGYGVTWDGNLVPTLTANEVETVIISVGGGSTTIQAAALKGRGI